MRKLLQNLLYIMLDLSKNIGEDNAKFVKEFMKLSNEERHKALGEKSYYFFKSLKNLDDTIAQEFHKVNFFLIFKVCFVKTFLNTA